MSDGQNPLPTEEKSYQNTNKANTMQNLTKREIDIIESSDIEWCPDDMSGDNTDIVLFNEKDCDKALHLIGRK